LIINTLKKTTTPRKTIQQINHAHHANFYTMKIVLTTALLLLTLHTRAQFAPVNGYWEGLWDESLSFNMHLLLEADGTTVTGTVTWLFIQFDESGNEIRQISKEHLRGKYDAKKGYLFLETQSEEDPHNLVVFGKYYFQMDASGTAMQGHTINNGSGSRYRMRMSRLGA
jgi:hypothetical protein